jgi:hypothetical protein
MEGDAGRALNARAAAPAVIESRVMMPADEPESVALDAARVIACPDRTAVGVTASAGQIVARRGNLVGACLSKPKIRCDRILTYGAKLL